MNSQSNNTNPHSNNMNSQRMMPICRSPYCRDNSSNTSHLDDRAGDNITVYYFYIYSIKLIINILINIYFNSKKTFCYKLFKCNFLREAYLSCSSLRLCEYGYTSIKSRDTVVFLRLFEFLLDYRLEHID